MKKFFVYGFFAFMLVTLAGCAAGPNPSIQTMSVSGDVAGFWLGLWHGIICPITFIVSLFSDGVSIYEVHNSGRLYNFGFVIGLAACFGGSGSASSSSSK